jgi:protein gp37
MHNPANAEAYAGTVRKDEAGLHWTGRQNLLEDRLERPYHWKKGRRVFVNSMADLFYSTPYEYLDRVFETIRATPQHFYLILTKYARSMNSYLAAGLGLPNVGLGVTVESADHLVRINHLLDIPGAPLYFVSYSPALGPVDYWTDFFHGYGRFDDSTALGWLIAEGQSGPGAVPSHPDRFRTACDQCAAAGVPFFFKGWGAWGPVSRNTRAADKLHVFNVLDVLRRMGKKRAGAMLDGHLYREYPEVITRHFEEE